MIGIANYKTGGWEIEVVEIDDFLLDVTQFGGLFGFLVENQRFLKIATCLFLGWSDLEVQIGIIIVDILVFICEDLFIFFFVINFLSLLLQIKGLFNTSGLEWVLALLKV